MNSSATELASMTAVEDSISQTAKLNLSSSSNTETEHVKASGVSSEAAMKAEISMPSGPKTRQALKM